MQIEFKGGRKPHDPDKPKLRLAPFIKKAELPAPPSEADYLSLVPSWPMYGNDTCGDCTIATVGHALQSTSIYGAGTELRLPDDVILSKYEELSGYVPGDESTDTGLVVQDVLNDWRKNGIAGHKALLFASIDPGNFDTILNAINIFGWVYLGVNITQEAMDQFNQGKPWVVRDLSSPSLGGHAIPCGRFNSNLMYVVTWGAVQGLAPNWWRANVEEVWAVVLPEWVNAQDKSPTGLDLYGLGESFHELTGEPNPFTPEPTPVPTEDPDTKFAAELHKWLDGRHPCFYKDVQKSARAWLEGRSL